MFMLILDYLYFFFIAHFVRRRSHTRMFYFLCKDCLEEIILSVKTAACGIISSFITLPVHSFVSRQFKVILLSLRAHDIYN